MPKLTAVAVKKAGPGRHADGGGLYLHVRPEGSRAWVLRIQVDGQRRDFGLGSALIERREPLAPGLPIERLRELTLAEARRKAELGRSLAKAGLDPSNEWRREVVVIPTFEVVAREYHEALKGSWRNEKHAAQWVSSLENHVFKHIGAMRVDEVNAWAMKTALADIWQEVPETARRVRQRIGAVLDYAKGREWRATEAPMRELASLLSKKRPKRGRYEAMPYKDVPAFMRTLMDANDTNGRLALRFVILTAARSGEVRGARWGEFDLAAAEWAIPADRMKAEAEHTVTLSEPALDILRSLEGLVKPEAGDLVFRGARGAPLSDMTLTKVLRDADVRRATVHGFRSAFKDFAREQCPSIPDDASEAALAHTVSDKVKAAYQRTKFIEMRRQLMAAWADYLLGRSGRVVRLAAG